MTTENEGSRAWERMNPTHEWFTASGSLIQRCKKCGAYSNLGSGYAPCPASEEGSSRERIQPPIGAVIEVLPDLSPREYQVLAQRTETNQNDARHRIQALFQGVTLEGTPLPVRVLHACIGIAGEAGELCGLAEKWMWYGKEELAVDPEKWADEIGDVLWYVALLCNAMGLDLGKVMAGNIAKLKARFPEKYTDEGALNRNREAEAEAVAEALREDVRKTVFDGIPAETLRRISELDKEIEELNERIRDSGDRRDWDDCDRLDAELTTKEEELKRLRDSVKVPEVKDNTEDE